MSLLSKSEMPSPKWPSLAGGGREVAAATVRLKRVRPAVWAGLAEGAREVESGQEGNAWGKLCNYYYITILMNNSFRLARGRISRFLLRT
jgi:hypothetical protein